MINITVYTNPQCVQCDITKRVFDKAGIKYSVIDLASVPDKVEEFKTKGYMSAPIVTTDTKTWSGFKLPKIQSTIDYIKSLERHP